MVDNNTGLPKKIRVLHVLQTLGTGGLENGVVNISNHIDNKQFQIDILCLRGTGELEKRIKDDSVRVIHFQHRRVSIIIAVIDVIRICLKYNYDIVHTHGWATLLPGYLGARIAGVRRIVNGEHGTLYCDTVKQKLMQKLLFGLVDLNLTVSGALRQEIIRKFSLKKDNFLPIINGVDTEKFSPAEVVKKEKRHELGISETDFIVGTVGRLVEVKNYPVLIQAFSELSKNHRDVKLILIGDGDQESYLREIASKNCSGEQVIFLGERSDVSELINTFDLFVLTSLREGLSNTVLEAMATGVPVLVTRVGGNPEIVVESETGYMFEAGDRNALRERMEELYSNNKRLKHMAYRARKHVCENLSIEKMVRNYEQAYCEVMNG